ncbi:MAG: hypothetical protein EA360_01975 [Balneolaceae bacterium]|nr:MAG: hypothetical protein EA360_01975 [Balneolaceae bacterium]
MITARRRRLFYWFVLLLATEMAVVYPAHLILDHSGIFTTAEGQPARELPDEEHCIFCLNMFGMETSSAEFLPIFSDCNRLTNLFSASLIHGFHVLSDARAPPFLFLS